MADLHQENIETETSRFKYINSIEREYNDVNRNVKSVTFSISRYSKYLMTIRFDFREPLKTEKETIEYVEDFLSKPLTEEWYQMVQDDTFHQYNWSEAQKLFECRGDILGDAKFLENTHLNGGNLSFSIGS